MESTLRIEPISNATDMRLSQKAGNAMLAEVQQERSQRSSRLELQSCDRELVAQGILAGADSLLGALRTAQGSPVQIAQGVLPELKIDQPETAGHERPRMSYQDVDGRWHFQTSQNDIAGCLKESLWNSDEIIFPHRALPDRHYDSAAAQLACAVFPRLRGLATKSGDTVNAMLIDAIIRNEQTYYRRDKDGLPDTCIKTWNAWLDESHTVTSAQIRMSTIKALAAKYPDVFGDPSNYPKAAENRFTDTLMVGAYLDSQIETFEGWSKTMPVRQQLSREERFAFDHAFPLWQQGKYADALIMSYNPGGGPDHLNNVHRQLRILRETAR